MKKALLVLLAVIITIPTALAYKIPSPKGYANDFADVLTPSTEQYVEEMGKRYEQEDGTQIVVVTIKNLEGGSIEDYSYDLFNDWGIGDKTEDNGILILLSVEDRRVRVEVGDGMEGIFNDAKVGRMLDNLALPYFSENDFDSGIKSFYDGIIEVLGNPEAFNDEETDVGELVGTIVLIIILIILTLLRGGRGGRYGHYRGGWGGYGGFGGFGGGGSSGGGFGGFGGGGSSGGGASRGF